MSDPNQTFNDSPIAAYRQPDPLHERIQQALWFASLAGTATILNSLPIALTILTNLRKNKVNIIVANLASADAVAAASFALGQAVYVVFWDQWGLVGCHFMAFLGYFASYAEYLLSPILAINRYVCLYHNENYDRIYSGKNIALMTCFCWAMSMVVPMIFWVCGKTGYDYDNMHCCIILQKDDIWWKVFYWLAIIVPLICFSGGPMIFCNYKIYKKLWAHAAVAKNLKDHNVVEQNKEIFYFLIFDTIPPLAIQTVYQIAKMVLTNRTNPILKRVFILFYMVNWIIRGIILLVFLRPFRNAMQDALRCAFGRTKTSTVAPSSEGNAGNIVVCPTVTSSGSTKDGRM